MRDTSPEELAQQAYERGYHAGYSDGRHRAEECARAWQALRDFLNGTAEEWAEREADAYADGENDGFDRGVAAVHELREGMSPPDLLPPWDRGEQR